VRRALAFLTPLPVGTAQPPDRRTLAWFPVVGALIGAVLGGVWWGAERLWPPVVAAGLVVAADFALTGMLHFDGLMDTADGLLSHLPRERRLEVMRQSDVGAYGVAIAVVVIGLRFGAIASMQPSVLLLAGIWCASRTTMAVIAGALPYVRDRGLATDVAGSAWRPIGLYGLIASVSLGAFAGGRLQEAAVASAFVGAIAVALLARRRIGGFTGDVLGAAAVIGETVALVVACASW
jgi:adenosylcobinamide-GDP ribazoletransferase